MGGGSSVFIAMTRWGAGMTLGTPRMTMRGNSDGLSRIGVRDMLS